MIMADLLMWTFIILGFYAVMLAYWLVAFALAPKLVAGSRRRFEVSPIRNLLIGLLVGVPVVGLGMLLFSIPNTFPKILGFGFILLPLLMGLFGSAGLCQKIGEGLNSPSDEGAPWKGVRRGGIVLGLTFIFPLLGWFMVLPLVLISGVGALVLSWRDGRKMPAPPSLDEIPSL